MKKNNWTLQEGKKFVASKRPIISPNVRLTASNILTLLSAGFYETTSRISR
jgi:hypothetical protein